LVHVKPCQLWFSSLSLGSFARLGSNDSIVGVTRLAGSISILDLVALGSVLSMRGLVRLGEATTASPPLRTASLSVFDCANLGSSFFFTVVRSPWKFRISYRIDTFNRNTTCQLAVVLRLFVGYVTLRSSAFARAVARLGSSLSAARAVYIGNGLSALAGTRLGSFCSALSRVQL
jgi:hypothetical protein